MGGRSCRQALGQGQAEHTGMELRVQGRVIQSATQPQAQTVVTLSAFEIKGLPPGKYTLEAIHEHPSIKPVTFEVEVKENASVRSDVTMAP